MAKPFNNFPIQHYSYVEGFSWLEYLKTVRKALKSVSKVDSLKLQQDRLYKIKKGLNLLK